MFDESDGYTVDTFNAEKGAQNKYKEKNNNNEKEQKKCSKPITNTIEPIYTWNIRELTFAMQSNVHTHIGSSFESIDRHHALDYLYFS